MFGAAANFRMRANVLRRAMTSTVKTPLGREGPKRTPLSAEELEAVGRAVAASKVTRGKTRKAVGAREATRQQPPRGVRLDLAEPPPTPEDELWARIMAKADELAPL